MRDYMRTLGNTTRKPRTKYILVTRKATEDQPVEGVTSDIRPVSSTTIHSKNEDLTKDSGIDVNSLATSTANEEDSSLNNSLEMNSRPTRDILRSRQSDNQLADLGSINAYLAQRKRIVIDNLMALLEDWLENNPAFASHAQEGSASSSRGTASGEGATTCLPGSHGARGKTRQKRSLQGNGTDGSDSNGDENGEGGRGSKRSRTESPIARKFACPFFKNNPSNHGHKQACTGPGWPKISRLNAGELEAHQRADDPCRKSSPKHNEGITESQFHQLKKKLSTTKTEVEHWQEVYRTVFPDAKSIPSPYYEYEDGAYSQDCDKGSLDFGEFVREELPQRVRNELEDRCNEFDNGIRTAFVGIVQSVLGEMTKQFKEQRQPAPSGTSSVRKAEPPIIEGSSTVGCPNPPSLFEGDFFQMLSEDSSLSFSLDGGGDMTHFDCRLSSPDIHFGLPTGNLDDSTYGSLEGSTGSPASFK
ncbi:hypothetical protein MGN70_000710 [Eutypa lata]|nr:hypothetical protein MGN70_000710 [Eutypa lata]